MQPRTEQDTDASRLETSTYGGIPYMSTVFLRFLWRRKKKVPLGFFFTSHLLPETSRPKSLTHQMLLGKADFPLSKYLERGLGVRF